MTKSNTTGKATGHPKPVKFRVDILNRIISIGKTPIPEFTNTELKLFVCLVNAKGKNCSREQLLVQAWGLHPQSAFRIASDTRRVDVAIGRIRCKVAMVSPQAALAIISVAREGYRLNCNGVKWSI